MRSTNADMASADMTSAAMTLRTLKLLIAAIFLSVILSVILSVMQAPSADAGHKLRHPHAGTPPTVVAGTAQHCRGANFFHCGPLYNANDYLGDDPDPFIRLMIQRDLGIKYGGEQ
jgi:hypothetical protein